MVIPSEVCFPDVAAEESVRRTFFAFFLSIFLFFCEREFSIRFYVPFLIT